MRLQRTSDLTSCTASEHVDPPTLLMWAERCPKVQLKARAELSEPLQTRAQREQANASVRWVDFYRLLAGVPERIQAKKISRLFIGDPAFFFGIKSLGTGAGWLHGGHSDPSITAKYYINDVGGSYNADRLHGYRGMRLLSGRKRMDRRV